MASRSLFTRLTLAMVAVLSFVAANIENGTYIIALFENLVLTAKHELGSPIRLEKRLFFPEDQQWEVKPYFFDGYTSYTITHVGPTSDELYLSPVNPKRVSNLEEVILSDTKFYWDFGKVDTRVIVSASIDDRFVLSIARDELHSSFKTELQIVQVGDRFQEWGFSSLDSAKQGTRSRSSPWRVQEDSHCL
ncbi:hypothetical protein B0O80DRAFT_531800 [Mortierella sp. GBAus27b]|nr:hypothetical protein BGX31_001517 [Mortierella sp. GBA43]KAI8349247.1 hypothetical protein B0O80DRAFT_531800 [Mortierella sp. GBAus27b]